MKHTIQQVSISAFFLLWSHSTYYREYIDSEDAEQHCDPLKSYRQIYKNSVAKKV